MSRAWLTPQLLEDGAQILRGVALVLARAAVDRYNDNVYR